MSHETLFTDQEKTQVLVNYSKLKLQQISIVSKSSENTEGHEMKCAKSVHKWFHQC